MKPRIWYVVTPLPDEDDGYRIARDTHDTGWHATETDAVMEAVQLAVDEARAGTPTGVRVMRLDGSVRREFRYEPPT